MPDSQPVRVLAFDFGLKHIGTAIGQSVTDTAQPLITLTAKRGKPRWQDIKSLLDEWQPTVLAVGLPLNMDDSDNPVTTAARQFAEALDQRFPVEVVLVDERLTTREALSLLADQESVLADKDASHNVAAALIAESYLRARAG